MVNNYLTIEKFLVASIRINIKLSLRRTLIRLVHYGPPTTADQCSGCTSEWHNNRWPKNKKL